MTSSERAKAWIKANPERNRQNARDSQKRRRLRALGKGIQANDPAAIARWWKERDHA